MASNEKMAEGEDLDVVTQEAADFKHVYTNHIQGATTAFDVSLTIGEVIQVGNGKIVIENRVRVSMSPLEAKVLQRIMTNLVYQHEGTYGPIHVPEVDVMPALLEEQKVTKQ